jgi:hypothetical protein
MAERFGGKYSPDNARPDATTGTAPRPRYGRTMPLVGVSVLFVIAGFWQGEPRHVILGLAAFGLLAASAWITREGMAATAAYAARTVARKPALPRKMIGALITGLGLATGAMMSMSGWIYPALFGLVGAGLHIATFGVDPMSDKGTAGIDPFQTDRIARAVDDAEAYLAAMKDATLRAGDRSIEARVEQFARTARGLFRGIEADPGDLTAARKYLTVYLMGARDAAIKFADLYARTKDPQARSDFEALLTDLETTFAARTTSLLSDNRSDLDIEISVLRERLARET